MKKIEQKVICHTPTKDKKPTRIDQWKYDAVRKAILQSLPKEEPGLLFKDLPKRVSEYLSAGEKQNLGSIGWYTTTVKLHLETITEIKRVENSKPQQLIRLVDVG